MHSAPTDPTDMEVSIVHACWRILLSYPNISWYQELLTMYLRNCIVNSSPPSAAYMRQWPRSALIQIMACRLFVAKPLSELMLGHCQFGPQEQTLAKFEQKYKLFIQENASETFVYDTVAILSWRRWANDEKRHWHWREVSNQYLLGRTKGPHKLVALLVISSFTQPGSVGHCLINGYYVMVRNRKHKAVAGWHANLPAVWRNRWCVW